MYSVNLISIKYKIKLLNFMSWLVDRQIKYDVYPTIINRLIPSPTLNNDTKITLNSII